MFSEWRMSCSKVIGATDRLDIVAVLGFIGYPSDQLRVDQSKLARETVGRQFVQDRIETLAEA
jgi:hypothetical protein